MDQFFLNIHNMFVLQHMATILIVSVANSSIDNLVLENGNSWNTIIREKAKVKILSIGS